MNGKVDAILHHVEIASSAVVFVCLAAGAQDGRTACWCGS